MRKSRLEEYEWDEKTEVGTFVYEDGRKNQAYQPLPVSQDLKSSYFADLLLWIRLERG